MRYSRSWIIGKDGEGKTLKSILGPDKRFSNVSSVILHSLSRNCFTIKNQIFSLNFRKCRNLQSYNRNQHIKQHNKTILRYNKNVQSSSPSQKRNSLTELIFLFRTGLSRLTSKLSLISRIYL